MREIFEVTRAWNGVIAALLYIIIALKTGAPLYPALAIFFATSFGNAVNDYFDFLIDAEKKPSRPIPSGKIGRGSVLFLSIILLALSLLFSGKALPLVLFTDILLFLYSWKIKRLNKPLGNAVVAFVSALVPFVPLSFVPFNPLPLSSVIFTVMLAREIAKDVEEKDVSGLYGSLGPWALHLSIGSLLSSLLIPAPISVLIAFLPLFFFKSPKMVQEAMKAGFLIFMVSYLLWGG